MKVLVTGTGSGLGKYLKDQFKADGLNRGDPLPTAYYDYIIHCARDRNRPNDEVDHLQRLFSVPCGTFVYMSSVDVLSATMLDASAYAVAKLRCEQFIRQSVPNHVILRLGSLLGPGMKPNSLVKLLRGHPVTLSPESTFCCVRYAEVEDWIHRHMYGTAGGWGTANANGGVFKLSDICEKVGIESPQFGEHVYTTPNLPRQFGDLFDTIKAVKDFIHDDLASV